jgi:SSS family solute:Na+ symporter
MANTAMFYFLNQGVLMRFMAAKSVNEGRKAALTVPIVLMPLAAIAVASGGWVGKALSHAGILPPLDPDAAFFVTAEFLSHPGIFGLIMAALTAALMSTVDSLVTGVAAIIVNDVYKPVRKKAFAKGWGITKLFRGTSAEAGERDMLAVARWTSVSVAVVGLLLVPVFMTFESIYTAHGAFTAAVTPPLVIALLFSVFWRRFTRPAAVWTMAGGAAAIILSIAFPVLVEPFSWGVPADEAGHGILAGMKQFKFTRAFFGLSVSAAIGVVVTLFTRPEREKRQRGLVWTSIADALARYKGSPGEEILDKKALAKPLQMTSEEFVGEASLSVVNISKSLASALDATPGDLLYVSDSRRWLGGLHSCHVTLGEVLDDAEGRTIEMGPEAWEAVVVKSRRDKPVRVERLY